MAKASSTAGLLEREAASFAARCRRHGFSPEQFQVDCGCSMDPGDARAPLIHEIAITHRLFRCRRRYRSDLSNWLELFENDLRSGRFHA